MQGAQAVGREKGGEADDARARVHSLSPRRAARGKTPRAHDASIVWGTRATHCAGATCASLDPVIMNGRPSSSNSKLVIGHCMVMGLGIAWPI